MGDCLYRFWSQIAQIAAQLPGEGALQAGRGADRSLETSPPSLRDLAADARARVPDPPAWDDVADDARRLRLGALQADAAVMAGLMTDVVRMTSVDHWPADVKDSLSHLHLYDKYSPTTLHGVLAHLSSPQIGGLTNSVKGTLLELYTADHMNLGEIPMAPDARYADLAHTLNQPGWDVAERATDGHAVLHVQVKATDHWQVIAHHLGRYPEYPDVATTPEGAQAMLQHGVDPQHVIDTGWHADSLADHVGSHMYDITAAHAVHELVPEIAIVAILTVAALKLRKGESPQTTAAWVKKQVTLAGVSNLAGLAVQLLTGTVVLRPLAAIGTRFTFERGSVARRTRATLGRNRGALRGLRESCEARGYAPWFAARAAAS